MPAAEVLPWRSTWHATRSFGSASRSTKLSISRLLGWWKYQRFTSGACSRSGPSTLSMHFFM